MTENPIFLACMGLIILAMSSWVFTYFLSKYEAKKNAWANLVYSDLTTLVREAIETQAFLPLKADKEPFLQSMPQLFEDNPDYHLFTLLESTAEQAGFIALLPYKEETALSIGPMYISKLYRGKGLGKKLVINLIDWVQVHRKSTQSLYTQTWGQNEPSKRIFEGLGFEFIGEEPNSRVNGDSTVYYHLHIGS